MYRQDVKANNVPPPEELPLLQFKLNIAECLLKMNKGVKRGRPSTSSSSIEEAHRAKAACGPTAPITITAVRTVLHIGPFILKRKEKV